MPNLSLFTYSWQLYWTVLCQITGFQFCRCLLLWISSILYTETNFGNAKGKKTIELFNCVDSLPPLLSSSIYSLWHHLRHYNKSYDEISYLIVWTVKKKTKNKNHLDFPNFQWIGKLFKIFSIWFVRLQESVCSTSPSCHWHIYPTYMYISSFFKIIS